MTVLDEFRPNGPTRSMGQKRPERPIYDSGVHGKPFMPRVEPVQAVEPSS